MSQQALPLHNFDVPAYSSSLPPSINCVWLPNIVLGQTNSTPNHLCAFKWPPISSELIGQRFRISVHLPHLSSSLPFNPPLQIYLSRTQFRSNLKSQPRLELIFETNAHLQISTSSGMQYASSPASNLDQYLRLTSAVC